MEGHPCPSPARKAPSMFPAADQVTFHLHREKVSKLPLPEQREVQPNKKEEKTTADSQYLLQPLADIHSAGKVPAELPKKLC